MPDQPAPPPGGQGDGFYGISFDPLHSQTRRFDRGDLLSELRNPNVFSWIDVHAPDIGALNEVLRAWHIDLVLSSHFDAPEVLPRIVERPDCLAFYLYEVLDPERHLDTSHGLSELRFARMILVVGEDFVITYHRHEIDAVDYLKDSVVESFKLAGRTPGFIVFLLLQRCLYDYAHLNLANDNALDRLELAVLADDPRRLAQEISVAGRNILTLKKLTASLHIVLMLLSGKRSPFISNEARGSFGEMMQGVLSVRAAVDSSRDLLDGVLNSMQAAAANRTSDIARVLTVVSGVLLPLTLITGIYGMNFEHMPELKWRFGYYGVLGVILAVGCSLVLLFRRLGWLTSVRAPRG